jgi:hypothetical protein
MTQFVASKLIFQISYSSCGHTGYKCVTLSILCITTFFIQFCPTCFDDCSPSSERRRQEDIYKRIIIIGTGASRLSRLWCTAICNASHILCGCAALVALRLVHLGPSFPETRRLSWQLLYKDTARYSKCRDDECLGKGLHKRSGTVDVQGSPRCLPYCI